MTTLCKSRFYIEKAKNLHNTHVYNKLIYFQSFFKAALLGLHVATFSNKIIQMFQLFDYGDWYFVMLTTKQVEIAAYYCNSKG